MKIKSLYGSKTYEHYCPGCEGLHPLPSQWKFNGNLESPSFTPSFNQMPGNARQCHYVITDGIIHYQTDSWHELKGQKIPMPDIPEEFLRKD